MATLLIALDPLLKGYLDADKEVQFYEPQQFMLHLRTAEILAERKRLDGLPLTAQAIHAQAVAIAARLDTYAARPSPTPEDEPRRRKRVAEFQKQIIEVLNGQQ